jgi:cytosine/adenosine deaminase-related metal-dependent hydrolase
MIVHIARHVLPIASPPLADAGVAVENGIIAAVGRRKDVLKAAGSDAEVREHPDSILFPALVNAHSHLELSWAASDTPPEGGYMGWLRAFLVRRPEVGPAVARAAAEEAARTMAGSGTVAVGDVSNDTWIVPILAASPLQAVVFHEVYGFPSRDAASRDEEAGEALRRLAADPAVASAGSRLRMVATPHAAHTSSVALLKALAHRAAEVSAPISIHAAESEEEIEFLRAGTGPLADLLRDRGHWDEAWRVPGLSPVAYLDRLGLLGPKTLVVHAVHLDHHDLSLLQARGSCVVTCPRSNRRLEVGRAPVPKLLSAGVPVALGTDSLATGEDLDLFGEMAALREEHPALAPAAVLRMATLNGALALGFEDTVGSIAPGMPAHLLVAPLWEPKDDPFETVTWGPESFAPLEAAAAGSRP